MPIKTLRSSHFLAAFASFMHTSQPNQSFAQSSSLSKSLSRNKVQVSALSFCRQCAVLSFAVCAYKFPASHFFNRLKRAIKRAHYHVVCVSLRNGSLYSLYLFIRYAPALFAFKEVP